MQPEIRTLSAPLRVAAKLGNNLYFSPLTFNFSLSVLCEFVDLLGQTDEDLGFGAGELGA